MCVHLGVGKRTGHDQDLRAKIPLAFRGTAQQALGGSANTLGDQQPRRQVVLAIKSKNLGNRHRHKTRRTPQRHRGVGTLRDAIACTHQPLAIRRDPVVNARERRRRGLFNRADLRIADPAWRETFDHIDLFVGDAHRRLLRGETTDFLWAYHQRIQLHHVPGDIRIHRGVAVAQRTTHDDAIAERNLIAAENPGLRAAWSVGVVHTRLPFVVAERIAVLARHPS